MEVLDSMPNTKREKRRRREKAKEREMEKRHGRSRNRETPNYPKILMLALLEDTLYLGRQTIQFT